MLSRLVLSSVAIPARMIRLFAREICEDRVVDMFRDQRVKLVASLEFGFLSFRVKHNKTDNSCGTESGSQLDIYIFLYSKCCNIVMFGF